MDRKGLKYQNISDSYRTDKTGYLTVVWRRWGSVLRMLGKKSAIMSWASWEAVSAPVLTKNNHLSQEGSGNLGQPRTLASNPRYNIPLKENCTKNISIAASSPCSCYQKFAYLINGSCRLLNPDPSQPC
ncbi:UNVERIFIED_CONTAM: hypothetical protein FKN15_000010 [Acipenser sinensis]